MLLRSSWNLGLWHGNLSIRQLFIARLINMDHTVITLHKTHIWDPCAHLCMLICVCVCVFVCLFVCMLYCFVHGRWGWSPDTFLVENVEKIEQIKGGQRSRNYVCVSGNWVPARMAMFIGKIWADSRILWYPICSQTPFEFMIMLLFHHSSWSCAIPCVISLKQRAGGFYTHFISDLKVRGFPDNDHQNINQFAADMCGAAIQKATV